MVGFDLRHSWETNGQGIQNGGSPEQVTISTGLPLWHAHAWCVKHVAAQSVLLDPLEQLANGEYRMCWYRGAAVPIVRVCQTHRSMACPARGLLTIPGGIDSIYQEGSTAQQKGSTTHQEGSTTYARRVQLHTRRDRQHDMKDKLPK